MRNSKAIKVILFIIGIVIVCFVVSLAFIPRRMGSRLKYSCEELVSDYEANKLSPKGYLLYEDLCRCYIELDKLDKAIPICEKAIESYPERSHSYLELGKIYAKRGEKDLALQQYKRLTALAENTEIPSVAEMVTKQAEELLEEINRALR